MNIPHAKFKLALVTGASSGIGAALCRLLARQGIALLITGRNAEHLQELVTELQHQVKVIPFIADLNTSDGRQIVIEKIYEHVPDLVINNAGFGLYGEALSYETKAQKSIFEVNGMAVLELTLESARALVGANRKGVIMNISSAAGEIVFPFSAVYGASKAFVTHLSNSLDYEFRRHDVRVLVACPGVVETAFRARASGRHASHDENKGAMTAEYAANEIWHQVEKMKVKRIFNWRIRLGIIFSKFLPQKIVAKLIASRIESYHPARPLIVRSSKSGKSINNH